MKKNIIRGLALAILLPGIAACSLERPAANEWGCTFGKGPLDEKGLKGSFAPGAEGAWTNDDFKTGPADVRFYIIDSDPATADFGGRPIVVPAKGSSTSDVGVVPVSVETQVRFVFNERYCDWYINHGRRSEPLNFEGDKDQPSGWNSFLNTSMNQKLIEAARPVVAGERYDELYVNALIDGGRAYDVLARELSSNLSNELERDLGGEYFCGPSYEFDGNIDGELENGCPPLEVTIKAVTPVDAEFIDRLETIVANEEQQKVIESNKERQLQQIAATEAENLRQIQADQEVQVAEQAKREEVETARADADLEIRKREQAVFEQQLLNKQLQAEADAAFCAELSAQGVPCELYEAARAGVYPRVILGDDGADVLIGVDP